MNSLPGSPANSLSSVALRPSLATGLLFSEFASLKSGLRYLYLMFPIINHEPYKIDYNLYYVKKIGVLISTVVNPSF